MFGFWEEFPGYVVGLIVFGLILVPVISVFGGFSVSGGIKVSKAFAISAAIVAYRIGLAAFLVSTVAA